MKTFSEHKANNQRSSVDNFGDRVVAERPFLMRFAARNEMSEDVVQETMLRAIRFGGRFEGTQDGLRAWLATIMRRESQFSHRRRHSYDAADWNTATPASQEDRVYLGELSRRIAALPGNQGALVLAALDRPYREIAAAFDTTEKAVKSALCRARKALAV